MGQMTKKEFKKVVEKIAIENNTSSKNVIREMEKSIELAYADKNEKPPKVEEFIEMIIKRVEKR